MDARLGLDDRQHGAAPARPLANVVRRHVNPLLLRPHMPNAIGRLPDRVPGKSAGMRRLSESDGGTKEIVVVMMRLRIAVMLFSRSLTGTG